MTQTTEPIGMPPDLIKKGWRLSRQTIGDKFQFRAKNPLLNKFSSTFDTVELAIAAALELDAGKTQVLNGETNAIEFKSIEDTHVQLKIALLRRDGGTQFRAGLDQATVDRYVEDKQKGDRFPPSIVYFDGTNYWLAAGFHRTAADEKLGRTQTVVEIRKGTLRDAILFAAGENAQHGLPRTNEEKRNAALKLLKDSEWSLLSDNTIAKHARVSQPFVSTLRRGLTKNVLSEGGIVASSLRRSASGREINTTNIGRRRTPSASLPGKPIHDPEVDQFLAERGILRTPISDKLHANVVAAHTVRRRSSKIIERDRVTLRELDDFVATSKTTHSSAKKLGRPPLPKGTVKAKIVPMRLKDEDVKLFERAAKAKHKSLSEWMRSTLRDAVKKSAVRSKRPVTANKTAKKKRRG